jgi:hypothetical protein
MNSGHLYVKKVYKIGEETRIWKDRELMNVVEM